MRDLNSETNVPKIQCTQYKQKRTSRDGSKHYEYCDQTGSCTWTSDPPGSVNYQSFCNRSSTYSRTCTYSGSDSIHTSSATQKDTSVTPSSSMSTSEIIGIIILVLIVLIIPFLIYWLNRTRPYQ